MVGYNWNHGKSNNAVEAENNGLLTAGQMAKFLGKCDAQAVKDNLGYDEWHHSSSYFNKVYYFDPENEISEELLKTMRDETSARKTAGKEAKSEKVFCRFPVWGGSRKRPKIVDWVEKTGIKTGNWIKFADGSKKKADGKWIEVETVVKEKE